MNRALMLLFAAGCGVTGLAIGDWPLVTMRQMSSTTFSDEVMRSIIGIDAKHCRCWDEYWFAESYARTPAAMQQRAAVIAGYGPQCSKAGIAPGFQQGVTLGHDFSKAPEDAYSFTEHAFQVDVDGKRTGFLCPRSPEVLAMEELYAETYVRAGKVVSFWLDDDLRMGFSKNRAAACFCDRCVSEFNKKAGTSFSRGDLVTRLSSDAETDPLRVVWGEFKAESLALFAEAAKKGALKGNPSVRLGYQSISSASICCGTDYRPILDALSDGGKRPVGIRPGHGYYSEFGERPCIMIPDKLLDVAREAERCHAYQGLDVRVVYEQENYPHHVMYKSPEAALKEAALALSVGCDAVSLYWYSASEHEPLEHYEDFARLAAAWRQYLERLAALSRGTHLGGVAIHPDPTLMSGRLNTITATLKNALPRRNSKALILARLGIPVTIAEAGAKTFFTPDEVAGDYTCAKRTALLDQLDARGGKPVCIRIDKLHQMLAYPRVDADERTVAVTLINLSIGRTQGLSVRIRRPFGGKALLARPCTADVKLETTPGNGNELVIPLPDLAGWEMATVVLKR